MVLQNITSHTSFTLCFISMNICMKTGPLGWKQLWFPPQKVPIPSEDENTGSNRDPYKNLSPCFHANVLISLVIKDKQENWADPWHTLKKKKIKSVSDGLSFLGGTQTFLNVMMMPHVQLCLLSTWRRRCAHRTENFLYCSGFSLPSTDDVPYSARATLT